MDPKITLMGRTRGRSRRSMRRRKNEMKYLTLLGWTEFPAKPELLQHFYKSKTLVKMFMWPSE